jgi:hypothetical protein
MLAAKRLEQAMSLIEHEWQFSSEKASRRLWVEIGAHHLTDQAVVDHPTTGYSKAKPSGSLHCPDDPANLTGREAATPWDRGRAYAHDRSSFDTE